MTEAQATATTIDIQRIRITTPRSFDDVLTQLRQLIGTAAIEQYPGAMQQLGGVSQENFETVIRSQLGPSEFMLFHEINHSQWLPVYGVTQRVLRLIFGNPIIAFTMMRDDLTAGLFAPVEALLVEHDKGDGCTVSITCRPPWSPRKTPRCYRPPVNSTRNSMPSSATRPAYRFP